MTREQREHVRQERDRITRERLEGTIGRGIPGVPPGSAMPWLPLVRQPHPAHRTHLPLDYGERF